MAISLMQSQATCNGSTVQDCSAGGVSHGTMCRRAVEDLPECMARHFKIEAVQLDGGDFHCHSDFVSAPGAVLSLERIARKVHLSCTVKDDWIALALPVEPSGSRFNGEEISDSRVPLAVPGAKGEWSIGSGADLLVVLADRARLLALAEQGKIPSHVARAIAPHRRLASLRTDPLVVKGVREDLLALLGEGLRGDFADTEAFEKAVLEGMVRAIGCSSGESLGMSSASSVVRRAMQVATEMPKKFTAADLSAKLQISPRTLRHAFKAVTGSSPHAYFIRERLNAARAALLQANPDHDQVTNIALELGFTELGRFSTRYRQLFGEPPSVTLARRPEPRGPSAGAPAHQPLRPRL